MLFKRAKAKRQAGPVLAILAGGGTFGDDVEGRFWAWRHMRPMYSPAASSWSSSRRSRNIWTIGKRLFNRPIGIVAAFCLALAPLHINYTRVVRERAGLWAALLSVFLCQAGNG